MIEKIGNNPLLVSVITILLTTLLGGIGFLIKNKIQSKDKKKDKEQEEIEISNRIVQNFNQGVAYSEIKEIATDIYETRISVLKEEMKKVVSQEINKKREADNIKD